MNNIIERQTFVFSLNMHTLALTGKSQIQTPVNLRFAADELILKSVAYNTSPQPDTDTDDMVQIWCNLTNDGLLTAFPNGGQFLSFADLHFKLNNTFQTGNIIFQFQTTINGAPFYYNPQNGIVNEVLPATDPPTYTSNTNGFLSFTIEFVKYLK